MAEIRTLNPEVLGSSPSCPANEALYKAKIKMIVITSTNKVIATRLEEITQKMIDKKLLSDNPQSIQNQIEELKKFSPDALDSIERVIDNHKD